MTWILLVVVVAAVLAATAWAYNSLVRGRVRLREAWAQIDVQLTRRHDLIPNLVETVKGYATHEQNTLMAVTRARVAAIEAQATSDPARVGPAEAQLNASVTSLLAVAERYPTLQAAAAFLQLQEELTATEDKIAYARHFYNTSVRDYNMAVQTIPRSVLASAFGFRPAGYFELEADERAGVQISSNQLSAGTAPTPQLPTPTMVEDAGHQQLASAQEIPIPADRRTPDPGLGNVQLDPTNATERRTQGGRHV